MAKKDKSKKSGKPIAKGKDKKSVSKADKTKAKLIEKQKKMTVELEASARIINTRMEKFYERAEKANDMREAAAIEAASAKEKCESVGIAFKKWVEQNLTGEGMGYDNIRKLAVAGASDDVKLAIADMRVANKEANKKLRDNKEADKKKADKKKKKAKKQAGKPEGIIASILALYEKLQQEDRQTVCNVVMKDCGYETDDEEDADDAETVEEDEVEDEAEAEAEADDDEDEPDDEDDDDDDDDD